MYQYTNEILIAAGLVSFTLVALLRREWGIYLIVLLLPSYQIRFKIASIPMTFLEGMILILAIVELIRYLSSPHKQGSRFRLLPPQKLWRAGGSRQALFFIFLFLLAATIAIFVSPVKIKAAGIFKAYFLEAVLFYFLVLLIIDTPEKLKKLWQILAILVIYFSVFGIYQFITLYGLPYNWWAVNVASRRIVSLLNHPNALALLLGPLLAMLIMLPKKNKFLWVTIILGLITLYLSFSRAAWLALAITLLGLSLFTKYKKKVLMGILIALLIIFLIPFSRQKTLDLIQGQDLSLQNRFVLWTAALDMLKKSPVLGVGLMGFHEAYKNYPLGPDRVVQNYPHNFFLNFWLETGLLGLIAMLGLLVLFFKKVWAQIKNPQTRGLGLAAAAGMSMIILHGLVDVSYFKNDLSILFWLIFALPNLEPLS